MARKPRRDGPEPSLSSSCLTVAANQIGINREAHPSVFGRARTWLLRDSAQVLLPHRIADHLVLVAGDVGFRALASQVEY